MRAPLLAPLLALVAVSCDHAIPTYLADNLSGTWEWQANGNPGGSGMTLSLTTTGTTIAGSGTICGIGPAPCAPGHVTIAGQATGVAFQITIRAGSGYSAAYSGSLVAPNELSGTWSQGNSSNTVIFYRH